jgi:hypothetical protein
MMIEFEDHSPENQEALLRYLAGERVPRRLRATDVAFPKDDDLSQPRWDSSVRKALKDAA